MIKWLSKNRQTIARLGGSVLAVVLLVILVREESGAALTAALKRVSIWYFLGALLVMLISRMFVVVRWHILLRSAGVDISFWRTAMITFTGLFANNFLPTTIGGDVVRLAGAMQLGYDRAICLASMVADRLIGMAGMLVTLPLGLIPVLSLGSSGLQSVSFGALFQKGWDFAKRTLEVFAIWLKKPLALIAALGATFGNMIFIFLAIFLLITGMGDHVSYWLIAGLWSSDIFCYPGADLSQWVWCSGTLAYIFTFKIWRLKSFRKPDHCRSYTCFVYYHQPAWRVLFTFHSRFDE